MRYYDPVAGSVRIDGVDLRRLDPGALRRVIGLVPQDPAIFALSAEENIRFGDMGSRRRTPCARRRARRTPMAFLAALPQGYATAIGERGVTLSGGERQRVSIARAILKNAPILLLDEATSALDAESETAVQDALETSDGRPHDSRHRASPRDDPKAPTASS